MEGGQPPQAAAVGGAGAGAGNGLKPEAGGRYEPFYRLYTSLYPALRGSFETLYQL